MLRCVSIVARRELATRARDPFSVLGISPRASLDTIKSAYRHLALELHPDICKDPGSVDRFAEVVHAYEAITGSGDDGEGKRSRRSAGIRGQRVVGGVLVVSIDELRRDPAYHVFALRLKLNDDEGPGPSTGPATASADPASSRAALCADIVHSVCASEWDSVGDLRRQLQQQLELPESLRYEHDRHRDGGHELIAPGGRLLGEHLFLADYELCHGDTLYFAVRRAVSSGG